MSKIRTSITGIGGWRGLRRRPTYVTDAERSYDGGGCESTARSEAWHRTEELNTSVDLPTVRRYLYEILVKCQL